MKQKREMICIVCPNGCRITVCQKEDGSIQTQGNRCSRGEAFAIREWSCPMRTLTTTVRTVFEDFPVLPVRTEREIPKSRIWEAMQAVAAMRIVERVHSGDVVCENLAGTDSALIATASIPKQQSRKKGEKEDVASL